MSQGGGGDSEGSTRRWHLTWRGRSRRDREQRGQRPRGELAGESAMGAPSGRGSALPGPGGWPSGATEGVLSSAVPLGLPGTVSAAGAGVRLGSTAAQNPRAPDSQQSWKRQLLNFQ